MKRILSVLLVLVLVCSLMPLSAEAATADSQAGVVTTPAGLNIRAAATTGSRVLGVLTKGTHITLLSKSGDWWRVEYRAGQYGYCHADYISVVSAITATVNTDHTGLNVRSGPGTSYSRIGGLSRGYTVVVLSTSGGWSKILYSGNKTGYVSAQYLKSGAVQPDSQPGNQPVSLAVPVFKQADSRWGHVTLGSSGKTMAKIGCATTAIAMMESYRTGTTIYPDAMAKNLKYTSSGNVYWPSHFIVSSAGSGYLADVYKHLQNGKPVLLGAKSASGNQHWVVITGFTGGSLTADNFTINDPGSANRATLQQFLNGYPTIYKYFHY